MNGDKELIPLSKRDKYLRKKRPMSFVEGISTEEYNKGICETTHPEDPEAYAKCMADLGTPLTTDSGTKFGDIVDTSLAIFKGITADEPAEPTKKESNTVLWIAGIIIVLLIILLIVGNKQGWFKQSKS